MACGKGRALTRGQMAQYTRGITWTIKSTGKGKWSSLIRVSMKVSQGLLLRNVAGYDSYRPQVPSWPPAALSCSSHVPRYNSDGAGLHDCHTIPNQHCSVVACVLSVESFFCVLSRGSILALIWVIVNSSVAPPRFPARLGDWVEDVMQGSGTFIYPNGDVYQVRAWMECLRVFLTQ